MAWFGSEPIWCYIWYPVIRNVGRKTCPVSTRRANLAGGFLEVVLFPILLAGPSLPAAFSEALIAKLDCPDRVKSVAFSPDGQFLAAAYGWRTESGVRVWKASDHAIVYTWLSKNGNISVDRVAFSPDARSLAAATSDGDILIWTVGTWVVPARITLRSESPTALAFSPDSRELALSTRSAVFLCDMQTRQSRNLSLSAGPAQEYIAAGFSSDASKLAVCRYAAVQWWDLGTGQALRSWDVTGLGFFCNLSPSRKFIVAGGGAVYGDKNVELMDASTGETIGRLSAIRYGLFAAAISHSDQWIALGGGNYGSGGDLSLWSARDFKEIGYVSAGSFPIEGLAFSPNDAVLAVGSDDGEVFLLSVEKLRGPERTKQKYVLCGELLSEEKKVYIVPLAKVPGWMSPEFEYRWKLEVAEPDSLAALAGFPVAFQDWEIQSDAATDKARVNKFVSLWWGPKSDKVRTEYAVFGDAQSPAWNEGFVLKVYGGGGFVAARNTGECLAYGLMNVPETPDFPALSARLVNKGLLSVPRDPLTMGTDHFRTRFIELSQGGDLQIRSDARLIDFSSPRPTKKQEEFWRIFDEEQGFVDALLHAGMHLAP